MRGNELFKTLGFGTDISVTGGNTGIDTRARMYRNQFLHKAHELLKDVPESVKAGAKDAEIARAHDILTNGGKLDGFSPEVIAAVRGIHKLYKDFRVKANEAGFHVPEKLDYLGRHTHNAEKVTAMEPDDWADLIISKLDPDEPMYKAYNIDPQDLRAKVLETYEDIRTGLFMREERAGISGGKRAFRFKNEAAWQEYNAVAGEGSIIDTMLVSVSSGARKMAIAETLGNRPAKTWEWLEQMAMKDMTSAELKTFNQEGWKITPDNKYWRDTFKRFLIEGSGNPEENLISHTAVHIGRVNQVVMLGSSVIKSGTDLAFASQTIRAYSDIQIPEFDLVPRFMELFSDKSEMDWMARQLWFETDAMLANAHDRMGTLQDVPLAGKSSGGIFDKVHKTLMSTTLLPRQARAADQSAPSILAGELARLSERSFMDLPERTKNGFRRVGITEKDWGNIRQHKITSERHGLGLITPSTVEAGSKDFKLASKVGMYLEFMRTASKPEASTLDKLYLTGGAKQDSGAWGLLHLMTQFKGYAFGAQRALRKIANANPNTNPTMIMGKYRMTGDLSSYAATMTYATVLAGMGIMAKDATQNKKTKVDANFVMRSAMEGAMPMAFEYLARVLQGEYAREPGRMQKSFIKDLAGPTAGMTDDVIQFLSGKMPRFSRQNGITVANPKWGPTLSTLINRSPGLNLFYVRPILDKLFLSDLHEYVNEGYDLKLRMRAARNGEQRLFP